MEQRVSTTQRLKDPQFAACRAGASGAGTSEGSASSTSKSGMTSRAGYLMSLVRRGPLSRNGRHRRQPAAHKTFDTARLLDLV
jgi:hypothetical protein